MRWNEKMDMTSTVDQNKTDERLSKLSGGLVCPVCKKQAAYRIGDEEMTSFVACGYCGTRTAEYKTQQEALDAWANEILY